MSTELVCKFRAFGIPKGQPRPRAFYNKKTGRAGVFEQGTAEAWKGDVALAYNAVRTPPVSDPVYLVVRFFVPFPKRLAKAVEKGPIVHTAKPDIDNALKATMDALTQIGAWTDDALVYGVQAEKWYATRDIAPGAEIEIHRRTA